MLNNAETGNGDAILRRRIKPPSKRIEGLEIRVARDAEEIERALALAYDAYRAEGFTGETKSRLRLTKYHALTTTTVVVAALNDEIVGTASVIQDSPFGIPTAGVFDLGAAGEPGARTVEISTLAIRKQNRSGNGDLVFPLFKFLIEYARRTLRADYLVIGVNPRHFPFYRAILLFEPLAQSPVESYAFANGHPSVGARIDLRKFSERMYDRARYELHFARVADYFVHDETPELALPVRRYYNAWDTVLDARWLEHFFVQRESILPALSRREASYVAHLFGLSGDGETFPVRHETRHPVACSSSHGEVRNASASGLMLVTRTRLAGPGPFRLDVRVAPDRLVQLGCETRWRAGTGCYGLRILSAPPEWKRFVDYLDNEARRSHVRV